eukprot:6564562-Prymnesium_polylepis.1
MTTAETPFCAAPTTPGSNARGGRFSSSCDCSTSPPWPLPCLSVGPGAARSAASASARASSGLGGAGSGVGFGFTVVEHARSTRTDADGTRRKAFNAFSRSIASNPLLDAT